MVGRPHINIMEGMGAALMASGVHPKLRIDVSMAELEANWRKWNVCKLAILGSLTGFGGGREREHWPLEHERTHDKT